MTANEDERLEVCHIELADTRPAMIPAWYLGEVPYEVGAAIFVAAGYCLILFGPLYIWWAPCLWLLAGKLISRDYHAITMLMRWLETTAWTSRADAIRHGGSSDTPMPSKSNREKGMASNAF